MYAWVGSDWAGEDKVGEVRVLCPGGDGRGGAVLHGWLACRAFRRRHAAGGAAAPPRAPPPTPPTPRPFPAPFRLCNVAFEQGRTLPQAGTCNLAAAGW
jgi:hypothetical protein